MPNEPYLDSSVAWRIKSGTLDFKEAGYGSTVEAILSSGLVTGVNGLISAGKEADVYLGTYHDAPIAVKVYRLYRTSHRGGRPIKLDSTGWIAAREFELTRQAWNGGVRVPAPARRVENMFSLRYLGDEHGPSPKLQEVRLHHPELFLDKILQGVEDLAKAGVVHTDLSAFNILVHEGEPWFIDFSEALRVDRTGDAPWMRLEQARAALQSGLSALQKYFNKYGLQIDTGSRVSRIVRSLDRFGVLE
jgi:serine/threonine-protein kinase RIO1